MEPATGPITSSGEFNVINDYTAAPIGITVNQLLSGIYQPIYTSPPLVPSENIFEPLTDVLVWFAVNQMTSTMDFESKTAGIEVIYAGITNQTVSFSASAVWSLGPLATATATAPKYGQW